LLLAFYAYLTYDNIYVNLAITPLLFMTEKPQLNTSTALVPYVPFINPFTAYEELTKRVDTAVQSRNSWQRLDLIDIYSAHPRFFDSFYEREIQPRKSNFHFAKSAQAAPAAAQFLTLPLTEKYPVGVRSHSLEGPKGPLLINVHYPAQPNIAAPYAVHHDPSTCTRSQLGLEPSSEESFPILIFSHGLGGDRDDYLQLVEEATSHGYYVVTVEHPATESFSEIAVASTYRPPTDEELPPAVIMQAQDVSFIVDQIRTKNLLGPNADPDSIGVIGHSSGGDTALQACRDMPVIKAGISLDGPMIDGPGLVSTKIVDQPFLIITGNNYFDASFQKWQTLKKTSPKVSLDSIPEASHNDFSMGPLVREKEAGKSTQKLEDIARKANQKIVDFFDLHLKGKINWTLEKTEQVFRHVMGTPEAPPPRVLSTVLDYLITP